MEKENRLNKQIEIGVLPFYYTPLKKPSNEDGIPNGICMSLEYIDGVIKQVCHDDEQRILNEAYERGSSITGLMEGDGIGKKYADDFLEYIDENISSLEGKEILEIGCGTGYMLSELRKKGANVLGIEPGTNALIGKEKYNVPIINDFFDVSYFAKLYDMVIFYCVLEHIYDTNKFIEDVKKLLKKDGVIVLAVPDCESSISKGDVSMLLHEHWNYYTLNSLQGYMEQRGLSGKYRKSLFAGSIFACLNLNRQGSITEVLETEKNWLIDYEQKMRINNAILKKYIISAFDKGESVGIYVPSRMINMLSLCFDIVPNNIRFFDDNVNLYGTYFPGIDIAIENFEDFKLCPTDSVIIASYTFGKTIKNKLLSNDISCKVVLLEELFR